MSADLAPHLDRLFPREYGEWDAELPWPDVIPRGFTGRCTWIGPGRFACGDTRYRHWLDGDGLVLAVAFERERVHARTRFVRSTKHEDEARAGTALYRAFGTRFAGDRLKRGIGLESPVNVSVYPYRDGLLAFGEQGLPWALDPVTLETIGVCTFGGQINEVTPFSAHAKIDPVTGELFNFGASFAAERPTLHIFSFDRTGRLRWRRPVPLPYPCSMHDFALSASYCVFHVSPYLLDVRAVLRDGASLIEALSWRPELGSHLVIVDRHTGAEVATVPAGHAYCLHLANAFEQDDALVVDVVEYERPVYDQYQVIPDLFTDVSRAVPVRLRLDLAAGRVTSRRELDYRCAPDFPSHLAEDAGRPYDDVWMLGISSTGRPGRKFFDTLVHGNWRTGAVKTFRASPGEYFGGEPLALALPTAEDRLVLLQRHDAAHGRSSLVGFDGRSVRTGPVIEIPLPAPVPALFHSSASHL